MDRIGHGYHIIDDDSVYDRCKKEKIHLECCLTSCCKIGGTWNHDFSKHPIKR